jgi:hypothetical protein
MLVRGFDEVKIKASALPPDLHDALTDRKRFNFKFAHSPRGPYQLFTARVEQTDEPGILRVFDIRDTQFIS